MQPDSSSVLRTGRQKCLFLMVVAVISPKYRCSVKVQAKMMAKKTIFILMGWIAAALIISDKTWSQNLSECVIQGQGYSVSLDARSFESNLDQPVVINTVLNPQTLPRGYFISNIVRMIQGPDEAEVVSGFPEISITCSTPGKYIFSITSSILQRTSCAGVSSCSLKPELVTIYIY